MKKETLEAKTHSFCETSDERCTMNYCDENGCQNRKRELVELRQEELERGITITHVGKPKQETLEQAAERIAIHCNDDFIKGAKWQQEIMHFDISEKWGEYRNTTNNEDAYLFMVWLKEQFKKK